VHTTKSCRGGVEVQLGTSYRRDIIITLGHFYHQAKNTSPCYLLNSIRSVPQIRSGCIEENKILFPAPGLETKFLSRAADSRLTMLTELPRLISRGFPKYLQKNVTKIPLSYPLWLRSGLFQFVFADNPII